MVNLEGRISLRVQLNSRAILATKMTLEENYEI